jgi:dephospho-CoA kinase
MLIVGLTGGIASGKTTVSKILEEEGAYLIEADRIARELVRPHTPAWKELIRQFGKEILTEDGAIHRKKLAGRVFSDPEQRRLLNQILHPRIYEEMRRRMEGIGKKDPDAIVVVDVPLLVETGGYGEMDRVIVVTSTETQQVERLKEREGTPPEEARRILSSQASTEERIKVADFVIHNEGLLEDTRRRTREVFRELRRIADQKIAQPLSPGNSKTRSRPKHQRGVRKD